ncbi:CRP-like cAMP-binding protein [Dokdonia sp. Hel_I_63]|uniref:Crp/Fnr family transcriptional regulator n=1 Tax=unclassified Dokdonia TaxID=2615033 RepID=UPI00020A688E|nr:MULTISPECIES: Crp/Fnr family transcriptional regulator [unclassified Dokdonia]AEE20677.1 putative transcriptional regulator, Crp/Fnr family [Dokdonia sp. 4H-3-7-5]TVZ23067.1 CRP-like cAMP-binding protein [Dokdonia sp. Hel_I_63]
MDEIRTYINQFAPVSDIDWKLFTSKLVERTFKKKETILEAGVTENYISFIKEGSVRLFIPKESSDKEITFGFCFENQFVSAYDSFLVQEPSDHSVQALVDTVILSVSYKDLQEIYEKTAIGNLIGRLTAESLFITKSKRLQSLLDQTAEERYLSIFKERPQLLKEIPLKYISSYIGVTPQALSRIRKRIS